MAAAPAVPAPRLADLSPEQAAQAAALLDDALDLGPAARQSWLDALAARQPALAALLAGLLHAAQPAAAGQPETASLIARRLARAAPPAATLQGRRFGPWRVERLLGHGGMGSVWLAQRDDGLFEREVALKLVHASLFGPLLHLRFARERRILAALAHPNIARLLDAGIADDGQPYLALEYVRGQPLDAWCDAQRLGIAQRLALMQQVLAAVQHAHQNLVIHRDLKPANILVDANGQVRLLDFGIAKLMVEGVAAETELTQHAGRALTPHYASPEQLAGAPVGTASDVYALGVMLYELLCGLRLERTGGAAPRMSRQALGAEVAAARATTPRGLAQALAGDLDTIVQKALKADPAERYATADALLQDLQRHAAGLPVLARPDSSGYRLRKFVRRHRLRVAAAALAVLVLATAAGVSLWQARQARAAAMLAQAEAQRALAVQAFLVDLFNANSLRQPDPQRARQATARELLDAGALRVGTALKDQPHAQAAVLETMADMYFQLELLDDAARMREQRIAALERAHGPNDLHVAEALLSLAHDVAATHQRQRGPAALARAREIALTLGAQGAEVRGWIAIETARLLQYQDIGAMRREADAALVQFRAQPLRWTNLFHATQMAARARYLAGDQAGAQALNHEGLALAERHEPATVSWRTTPWVHLAESQIEALQFDAAEKNLRLAWQVTRERDGPIASVTLQTQAKLGGLLHATGRRDEGWLLLQGALAGMADAKARLMPDAVAAVRRFAGSAAIARGEFAAGLALLAAEVADLRAHHPRPVSLARALLQQGTALMGLRRFDEAEATLAEALALWQAAAGSAAAPHMANRFHLQRARLALARGDLAAAQQRLQAVDLPPAAAPVLALEHTQRLTLQAELARRQGRDAEAEAAATQALGRLREAGLSTMFPELEAQALRQRSLAAP